MSVTPPESGQDARSPEGGERLRAGDSDSDGGGGGSGDLGGYLGRGWAYMARSRPFKG